MTNYVSRAMPGINIVAPTNAHMKVNLPQNNSNMSNTANGGKKSDTDKPQSSITANSILLGNAEESSNKFSELKNALTEYIGYTNSTCNAVTSIIGNKNIIKSANDISNIKNNRSDDESETDAQTDSSNLKNLQDLQEMFTTDETQFSRREDLPNSISTLRSLSELSNDLANRGNGLLELLPGVGAQNYELSVEQSEQLLNKCIELVVATEELDAQYEKAGIEWHEVLPDFFEENAGELLEADGIIEDFDTQKKHFDKIKDGLARGLDSKELLQSLVLGSQKPPVPLNNNGGGNNGGGEDNLTTNLSSSNTGNNSEYDASNGNNADDYDTDNGEYDTGGDPYAAPFKVTHKVLDSFSTIPDNVMIAVMCVSMELMNNSYDAAAATAEFIDVLNDSLDCITGFNSFLTTLNSFYTWVLTAINADKNETWSTVDFDQKEVYTYSQDDKHGGDSQYDVEREGDTNILFLPADEVPQDAIDHACFEVVDEDSKYDDEYDGMVMITTDGMEDYLSYVSEVMCVALGTSPGDSMESLYAGHMEESSEEEGLIDAVSMVENEVNQQIQTLTSTVSIDTGNAQTAYQLFTTLMSLITATHNELY